MALNILAFCLVGNRAELCFLQLTDNSVYFWAVKWYYKCIMAELNKAFLYGGFSESYEFIEPLARAISEGPNRFVDEAELFTLAEARSAPEAFVEEGRRRIIITHSAGATALRRAGMVITLNGIEPTPTRKILCGSIKVGLNGDIGREDGVPAPSLLDAFDEVCDNSETLKLLLETRHFSTLGLLAKGDKQFPEGRIYLPTDQDEYGFGRHLVDVANRLDVYAKMLPGYHNQAMLHPNWAAGEIKHCIEELHTVAA